MAHFFVQEYVTTKFYPSDSHFRLVCSLRCSSTRRKIKSMARRGKSKMLASTLPSRDNIQLLLNFR